MSEHDQAPENPIDGQEFECSCCDYRAIWDEEDKDWFS